MCFENTNLIKPPDDKILFLSELKTFVDNKIKCGKKKKKFVLERIENRWKRRKCL